MRDSDKAFTVQRDWNRYFPEEGLYPEIRGVARQDYLVFASARLKDLIGMKPQNVRKKDFGRAPIKVQHNES